MTQEDVSREEGEKIVLETSGVGRNVPLLPPDESIPNTDVAGIAQGSLESAISFVGRNARTTGEESFELRSKAAIDQRQALVEWAQSNNLTASPQLWEGKAVLGASEHDVWQEGGEYWKVTRPDHFGWTVLPGENGLPESADATPLEYLDRWLNANRYLGDDAKIRGVVQSELGVQVVISHPSIDGVYPEMEEIMRYMESCGYSVIPDFIMGADGISFYHEGGNIGIFDASPDNFILSDGLPVPVDVITLIPGAKLRGQIKKLLGRR